MMCSSATSTTPLSDNNSQSQQVQLAGTGGLDQEGTVTNSTQGEEKKRKRNTGKTVVVDHTYSDYSTYELSLSEKRKGRVTFPMKLHAIISNPDYQHIICWMPHGRSWRIIDKEKLASVVCFENFNHDSFGSFTRSVNGWGFKRMVGPGPDQKSYYHECFLRGLPAIAQLIARVTTPGKKLPNPNGEPDFYDISKRFPLPDSVKVVSAPTSLDCRDTKRQCQAQQLSTTSDEISHASSTELVHHGYPSSVLPPEQGYYGPAPALPPEHGYYGHLQMYPNTHGQGNWQYPHEPPSPPYPYVRRFSEPTNVHGHYNQQHWNHYHGHDAGRSFERDSSRSGYDNSDYQGEDAAAKARYGEYEHDLNFRLDYPASRRASTSQIQPRFSSSARGSDFQFQPIQANHDQSLNSVTTWANEFSLDAETEYDKSLFPSGATSIMSTPYELGNGDLAEDAKPTDDFKTDSSNQGDWSEFFTEPEVQPPANAVNTNSISFGAASVRNDNSAPRMNLNWTLY